MSVMGRGRWSAAALLALVAGACSMPARAQGVQVPNDLTTRNVRVEQSNLADVAVDALRAAAKADIAWMTASAFVDATVPRGTAQPDAFVAALANPDDHVVVVSLTGAQVRRALERSVAIAPQKSMAFLQVSGLSFAYDPAAEKEKRVVSVRVGKAPLDPSRTYAVAMPAPLANGALAYGTVWTQDDVQRQTGASVAEALRLYLTPERTIGVKPDERILVRQ